VKQKFRLFTATIIVCIFILGSNVFAFTNSNYYDNQNISIGLESMVSSQLNITLNGDYNFNGVTYKSGTSYILKVIGLKIGFNGAMYDNISFVPQNSSNTIKILSSYSNNYLGTLTFTMQTINETSKIIPINSLYIEDYLKGVVGKEMSDYFPVEALKAQAVAARNYTLASAGKHKSKGYNLCDTTDCQVYAGYDTSLTRVNAAVDATKGMLLLSGTSIVEALYSASDGGYTEASENVWYESRSYFKAQVDSYDGYDTDYVWNKKYTNSDINNIFKLRIPSSDTFVKIDLSTITNFGSGRIKNISLVFKDSYGNNYTLSYGKESARTSLNLPSAMYNVSYDATSDSYSFNGKGVGHGVGMSQIGAKNRAAAGQEFGTILKFYYDGTTLINALPSINNISVDKDNIYCFDSPNFSVNATGGSGKGLTYKYVIEHNNTTLSDSGFVNVSNYNYNPVEAGSYNLKIYVKDVSSILDFEDTKTYSFNVKALVKVITFNSQGGSSVTSKTTDYNTIITSPTVPTKTGYIFDGWYKEAECLNSWNFLTDKVTSDATLYAKWTIVNPAIGVSLDKNDVGLKVGETTSLIATINPSNASNKNVTWTSSNTSVAKVDSNGKITATSYGTAIIKVQTVDGGYTASCEVSVYTTESKAIDGFVSRLYLSCFGRDADLNGLNFWKDKLLSRASTGADVANSFIFSSEFVKINVSNDAFIDIMYKTFFDRDGDKVGKDYWTDKLNNGISRLYILSCFVNSTEFSTICNNYGISRGSIQLTKVVDIYPEVTAFTYRFYDKCLDRKPDELGLSYWVNKLVTGQSTGAGISQEFVFSPEFISKNLSNTNFITIMYRVFFNREPDSAGQTYWVNILNVGKSRVEVLAGFVNSKEFTTICNSYGIQVGTAKK